MYFKYSADRLSYTLSIDLKSRRGLACVLWKVKNSKKDGSLLVLPKRDLPKF